jgi:hypothetical protein
LSCIPCVQNATTRARIDEIAELLKTQAHLIPGINSDEIQLYESGLFRGAIERIRGQFAASMAEKRGFAKLVLNYLQDQSAIQDWKAAGGSNRYDYEVILPSGRIAAIELKGCLDGNNTNIFERPPQAQEFYIWSVCQNAGASPPRNAWSGIHTRLGAEIIDKEKQVDGLIIWDMVCGTIGRVCPKLTANPDRTTTLGPYKLPPPCVYLFPATIASPRNNPSPRLHTLDGLEFLSALHSSFGGRPEEVFSVRFEARNNGANLQRKTTVERDGVVAQQSDWQSIRRS